MGATVGSCAGALTATAAVAATGAAAEAAGAGAVGAAGATIGAAAAAGALPSSRASRSPMLITSPSLTLRSLSTPAADDGISIEALSDSTVTRDCSTLMVSPTLTSTSMTETSLKSPMSGTRTSRAVAGPAAAAAGITDTATDSVAAGAMIAKAGGGFTSEIVTFSTVSAVSSVRTTEPCLTLSPRATRSSLTTPAALDGISIEALSDSTVSRDWSAWMVSPGLTSNSMTVTSSKSPMSGT